MSTVMAGVDASTESSRSYRYSWVLGLLVLIGTLLRLGQITHFLTGNHAFRQTQTAYVAWEYARNGIDLMQTPLPIFGPNASVPMEFPLVQAAAALLIRAGASPDLAMRTLGLIGFQATAVLLIIIVRRWHGGLTAVIVATLFEFSPFGLAWGATGLIDFPSVALALGMVLGLDTWFARGSYKGLLFGVISAWLAFLVKATTAPSWCLLVIASALVAIKLSRHLVRISVGLIGGPVVGLVLAAAWTHYADGVKRKNPLTEFLASTDKKMISWNFGTTEQRLNWNTYTTISDRIWNEIAGPAILVLALVVSGIYFAPSATQRILRSGWPAVAVSAPLIFLNLYYVHDYYLIGIFPAVLASVAVGIEAVFRRFSLRFVLIAPVIFCAGMLWNTYSLGYLAQWRQGLPPDPTGLALKAATQPNDLIVTVGCDWNPEFLYFADRKGLMIAGRNFSSRVWSVHNLGDYRYVFRCDPSAPVEKYLPPGYTVKPTSTSGLDLIVPPS